MGPYLQLRRWLADATSTEHRAGVIVITFVAVLLGWAIYPVSTDNGLNTAGAGAPVGSGGRTPLDAPAGSALGDGAPSTATAQPQSAGAGRASAGPSVTPSAPEGTEAEPGDAVPVLTASDRGVSETSLKVGFTIMDLANLGAHGQNVVGTREDIERVIGVLVDDINARGGVLGRKIQPVIKRVDLLSATDQQAKCLEFTRDEKVFAIVDTYSFLLPESAACITQQNDTPLITGFPGTDAEIEAAFPYLISVHKSETRVMRDLAFGAREAGFFDPAKGFKKLGLITHACRRDHIDGPSGLKRWLTELGVTGWSEFKVECTVDGEQTVGPPAVLKHRQDGVTHVMIVATETSIDRYTATAAKQQWFPKFFQSDYFNATLDATSIDYDPGAFNGALAYTQLNRGDPAALPPAQRCSKVLTDGGLPPTKSWVVDLEALTYCEHLELFVRAATAAGRDLTRVGLGNAVGTIGELHGTMVNYSRFDTPGKLSGGDAVALVEWRRDCTCWRRIGEFRPAWG